MMLYEMQKFCCSIFWYYEKIQLLYLGFLIPKNMADFKCFTRYFHFKHSINLIFPKSLLLHSYSFMLLKLWTYNYMSLVMFIMYDLYCMECVWYFDKTNYINWYTLCYLFGLDLGFENTHEKWIFTVFTKYFWHIWWLFHLLRFVSFSKNTYIFVNCWPKIFF